MMKLSEFLHPERIVIGLEAADKWDAITQLVRLLGGSPAVTDAEALLKEMTRREKTMTTGIGRGVAIPHASCDGVSEITVAAATTKEPLDFQSLDFEPVRIIFALACPGNRGKAYMELLSQIARMFKDPGFSERLAQVKTPDEFISAITQRE